MSRYVDWPAVVARLQGKPGIWERAFLDHPTSIARTVRERRHPALHLDGGRIEVAVQHEYDDGARRRGDILLRYVPEQG